MSESERALRDIIAELPPRPQLPLVVKIAEIARTALAAEQAKRVLDKRVSQRLRKLRFTDETWAVFNLHVNDAGVRAMKIVRARYKDAANANLALLERDFKAGIMAIFNRAPDDVTRMFATLCWVFANGLEVRK
jgi:hypothetical protein